MLPRTILKGTSNTKPDPKLVLQQYQVAGAFIYGLNDTVALLTPDVRYILWSKKWEKEFGLEGNIEVGKRHYDVFPEIETLRPEWLVHHLQCSRGKALSGKNEEFAGRVFNWWLTPVKSHVGDDFYIKMRVQFLDDGAKP